jgi:hypothetical protein
MHPIRTSYVNEYNSAVALYELNTYKKDRFARYFWFSWKLVLFVAAFRHSFLLIKKLSLLMQYYRKWCLQSTVFARDRDPNESNAKVYKDRIARLGKSVTRKPRNAVGDASFRTHEQIGIVPVSKSIYMLQKSSTVPSIFQKSSTKSELDALFAIVRDIYIISDTQYIFKNNRLSPGKYTRAIRFIRRYRLSLVRKVLHSRLSFMLENQDFENSLLDANERGAYHYMISYFFDLSTKGRSVISRLLRQNASTNNT